MFRLLSEPLNKISNDKCIFKASHFRSTAPLPTARQKQTTNKHTNLGIVAALPSIRLLASRYRIHQLIRIGLIIQSRVELIDRQQLPEVVLTQSGRRAAALYVLDPHLRINTASRHVAEDLPAVARRLRIRLHTRDG